MSLSLPLPSRSSQIRTLAITPASRKHKFLHIPVQQWTPSRPLQHLHTNHQYYLSRTSFQCMSRSQQQEYEVERLFSNLNQVTLKREPGIPVLSFFFLYIKNTLIRSLCCIQFCLHVVPLCFQEVYLVQYFWLLALRYIYVYSCWLYVFIRSFILLAWLSISII